MSSNKVTSVHDSLVADLLNMGFKADSIQHYVTTCSHNNSEPIISDAVEFLLKPDPKDLDVNISSEVTKIEERIPTVIGTSKSISYPNNAPLDLPPKPHTKQNNYEENIRDRFSKKFKLEKEQKKKYRQEILQQIECDRKEAKSLSPKFIPESDTCEIQLNNDDKGLFSRLSIRLLNGSVVVHYFNPMDTLDIVLTYLKETYDLSNILLCQSFPRIEYSPEDKKKFLLELGLGRSGSLIVKTMNENSELFGHANSTKIDTRAPSQPIQQPVLQAGLQAPVLALGHDAHDWGASGNHLGGEYIQKVDFLNRLETAKQNKKDANFSAYIVPLKELSFRILIQRGRDNTFPSLAGLSPLEGEIILSRFIKENMLTPKLVDKFIGCRMHTIDLTSCHHITNELLHRFNRFNSITTLIIKGSPYLTDKAITFIVNLPHLENLILENCENLTNNSCISIAKLIKLKHLNLRGSKVTNKGVLDLINSSTLTYIEYLNLGHTQVTEDILLHLGENCNFIKHLILESTNLNYLPNLGSKSLNFQLLRELDFSNCNFRNETNFCDFFKYLNLEVLKLFSANITDFTFLKYLKLKSITLPRYFFNPDGSSPFRYLVQYELDHLDLCNSLSLSQTSLLHIGQMQTLTSLNLKNCRTCEGSDFKPLCSLTLLNKLDLEHTKITDDASVYIFPHLTQLTHLNLSGTFISDRLLWSRILNKCKNLSMLNFNNTNVSNQGLSCLSIPYLHTLFLNGTLVNFKVEKLLYTNCANLRLVTLNNLRQMEIVKSDEESSSEID